MDIIFNMPANRAELLNELNNNYTVKNVVIPAEIIKKLSDAQEALREEGVNFIIGNFDTYYSVIHHANSLRLDIVFKAYSDLLKAFRQLDNSIAFLLDDKDSLNDENKARTVTIIKMLTYIFLQFVLYLEKIKNQDDTRQKNKEKLQEFTVDKLKVLNLLNDLLNREICLFWEPPVVEHDYVGAIAEFCYTLLQNPTIKSDKETRNGIFSVFGNLTKAYDYGKTFVARLIQTIRMYDHVVQCAPEGIKLVVEQFNCRPLVHHFVKEATEWQVDETYEDNQGTRLCSTFLTELAVLMPNLMIPEVMYLNQYLIHDSHPLRISVLNVITEVILKVLTKHDLNEEEKESRDEFLDVLIEHIRDVSALVRAKVIQNIIRLQKESAIPLHYQNPILTKIIEHLNDKAAAVKKAAINCITTFLQHNPFGANLQLQKTKEELERKVELLNRMEATYKEAKMLKIQELQNEWQKIEDVVKETIQEQLKEESDDENEEEEESHRALNKEQIVEIIRSKLEDKKFEEAVKLCRLLKDKIDEWKNVKKVSSQQEVTIYLAILKSFYLNLDKITDEVRTGAGMSDEDIRKIQSLENIIKYLESTISFLKIIDSAMEPMKILLFTQTIGDMHEAINFFVTAYQFQIDNASSGVTEMLKLMQYNEPERKEGVIAAFKTIYLTTDANNMADHSTTVLNRLISLLKNITCDNFEDFQNIVEEWTAKGILDNSIIDRCWQYYTKREPVSDEDARAAAELLRMAAMGRRTIIIKNIGLVTNIAFSYKNRDNLRFLASSCRLLAVAGIDKIDIQSESAPFKIKHLDETFSALTNILTEAFFKPLPFYVDAAQAGLDFIFRTCSKPIEICENILKRIGEKFPDNKNILFEARLCHILGYTALNILGHLDNTVYRELKRRHYVREARKENKKNNKNKRYSRINKSTLNGSMSESMLNESCLKGAEAQDHDADFILRVLETSILSKWGTLGNTVNFLTTIVQRPDLYNNEILQNAAVVALIRFMLLSENFCRDNMRLLFTVFEKTSCPELKCIILIHCSDLLTRFPNTVEPWSSRIYEKLKDPLVKVRKTAFFSLSNLILRDMIRAHSHISEMAACMIDENQEVKDMCKTFFRRLAQKEHNLANVMPDIFSHLVKTEEISEENLRFIMKFLFDLVDNSKKMENLVDRFCHKYTVTEDPKLNRNITYCLSLINYNDKALRKLHEKFPMYKHHVHDAEIYSTFKQILAECSKQKVGRGDLKPIVTDIEACIASVFEIDGNGDAPKPPAQTKAAKKTSRNRRRQKKSSDESDEENFQKNKSRRGRPKRKTVSNSDSD